MADRESDIHGHAFTIISDVDVDLPSTFAVNKVRKETLPLCGNTAGCGLHSAN